MSYALFVANGLHGSQQAEYACSSGCIISRADICSSILQGSTPSCMCSLSHAGPSAVDKSSSYTPLPSPVRRVFYLSREGTGQEHEVSPPPNPHVIADIKKADAVVYGMGSLYTSICPTLILDGVGEAIAARQEIPKVGDGSCCLDHYHQ